MRVLVKITLFVHRPDVIAVSGITNKSTVKRAIVERLQNKQLAVRANPKSYNTEIGLPLAVFYVELEGRDLISWLKAMMLCFKKVIMSKNFPRILVLEFGVSGVGDMRRLIKIVKPRLGVFTDIQQSDFNPRTSVVELANEINELMRVIPHDNGLVVYNADDSQIRQMAEQYEGNKVGFGLSEMADIRAIDVRQESDGISWIVNEQRWQVRKFGSHHIYAELAAFAVANNYSSPQGE